MRQAGLSEAICAMVPEAYVIRCRETDWHSATFSGKRVMLDLNWRGSCTSLDEFSKCLPELEFTLPGQLVVDIAVTASDMPESGVGTIVIEALVLDEDI